MSIELGDRVRDLISGFEGIVVGRTEWLFGCTRIGVSPGKLHEGKTIDSEWFDVQQLELVEKKALKRQSEEAKEPESKPGGPRKDPTQRRPGE